MSCKEKRDPKYSAILLMGGKGERFGSSTPKQFHRLAGKSVYLYTLEKCLQIAGFHEIVLAAPKEWIQKVARETSHISPKIKVVEAGGSRQQSCFLALLACDPLTDYVVIHDAVRPFVSQEILVRNLQAVRLYSAVDTCIPSADTLIRSSQGDFIDEIPLRKEFRRGQTPQSFSYDLIVKAHQKALEDQIFDSSDDCSLVLRLGHPIRIVEGSEENIKITTEIDLFIAEQMLRLPQVDTDVAGEGSIRGKVYIVTGGSGGIGSAICKELQREGAQPIVVSKSADVYRADLSCFQETQDVFQKIFDAYGHVDGLINSVGALAVKPFGDQSVEEMDEMISSNLMSVIYSCKCAEIKVGGHIINIASSAYTRGRKEYLIYSAAKAAVVNFTQGLADAMPDHRVSAVIPQRTDTKMRRSFFGEELSDTLLKPEQVAERIVSLLKQRERVGAIVEIRKDFEKVSS